MSEQRSSFAMFVKNVAPIAIAFLVSAQMSLLISDFQDTTISPFLGLALGQSKQFAALKYEYNPEIVFRYGSLLNRLISVTLTLYIVYLISRFSMSIGVDATKKLF